ncbi:MAG: NYN domain-containing protein [Planctomycetales bacterium]|nr:NYN domain-containing protein [Planctomycetales bacterium]
MPKLLIDGYNVLFQSQLVGRGRGRQWLPAARNRLMQLLASRLTPAELSTTQVVFDAPRVGQAPPAVTQPSGLSICYAVDHHEADDLLEKIMREHPTPKQLTVVSSDQRIRRCARAQRATSMDSQAFLDQLERRPASPTPATNPAQTVLSLVDPAQGDLATDESLLSAVEVDYWLQQFQPNRQPTEPQ